MVLSIESKGWSCLLCLVSGKLWEVRYLLPYFRRPQKHFQKYINLPIEPELIKLKKANSILTFLRVCYGYHRCGSIILWDWPQIFPFLTVLVINPDFIVFLRAWVTHDGNNDFKLCKLINLMHGWWIETELYGSKKKSFCLWE